MQLGIESHIPDGLLAANALLAENSCQGVPTSTHTLHRGFQFAISSTYMGLQFACYESASDPVAAPSNPCNSALQTANRTAAGVARANAAWNVLQTAADANGIPAALLASIGVRESNFTNVQEQLPSGAPGPGMGVFQLTNQPGVSAAQAFNLPFAANYAAGILASNMQYLSNTFSFTPSQLLQATAASYNFGVGNISGNPNTIDVGTTGGNYGSTVVSMMTCFIHT